MIHAHPNPPCCPLDSLPDGPAKASPPVYVVGCCRLPVAGGTEQARRAWRSPDHAVPAQERRRQRSIDGRPRVYALATHTDDPRLRVNLRFDAQALGTRAGGALETQHQMAERRERGAEGITVTDAPGLAI